MSAIRMSKPKRMAALLLLASSTATAGQAATWTPTPALIAEVEAHLVLPDGAGPLDQYGRYYYGDVKHGRRVLVGEFVQVSDPGVHIVAPTQAPRILDGGCSVINLVYDMAEKKVTPLFCNGSA